MSMIRRFVNIVAEDYKRGLYSLHRLDVSKHLFYPSTAQAAQANTGGGDEIERLQELPEPCIFMQPALTTVARSSISKMPFFGLLSPCSSESRIFSMNEVGQSALFNADERFAKAMPDLEEFKGHVHVSASIVDQAAGAKEEGTYIMHGVQYGLDFKSRFDVLRFGNPGGGGWYWHWQSLPLPAFIFGSHEKIARIISYTVVEDGRTICQSSIGEGTYCFDTAKGEWWKAGDWELPFDGRVVYVPDLKFWLGFCVRNPNNLCATSGLSDMALNQPPKLQLLWQNLIPKEWMAMKVNLLNLGSGKFAIAKVFKYIGESRYFSDSGYG